MIYCTHHTTLLHLIALVPVGVKVGVISQKHKISAKLKLISQNLVTKTFTKFCGILRNFVENVSSKFLSMVT
jgi:hypothetical protein